jgi:hypothetical protein
MSPVPPTPQSFVTFARDGLGTFGQGANSPSLFKEIDAGVLVEVVEEVPM